MNPMFHFIAKHLNRLSNYLIDWSRVGELLRSGRHRYSMTELIPRGFVATCIIMPLIIQREISWSILFQMFICFVVSHTIVIAHLIWKRYKTKSDCDCLSEMIKKTYCRCNETEKCNPCGKLDSIYSNVTLKSSAMWGYRKRKLTKLLHCMNQHPSVQLSQ